MKPESYLAARSELEGCAMGSGGIGKKLETSEGAIDALSHLHKWMPHTKRHEVLTTSHPISQVSHRLMPTVD